MHTRRAATFLLGAWLACSLFAAFMAVQNARPPGHIIASASLPAADLFKRIGPENTTLLLSYQSAEQTRSYLRTWELVQFGLGFILAAFLFLGTQRKILPLVLVGVMIIFVGFEHFALSPELAFRGREADFPPGNRTFGTQARLWAIEELYMGMEGAKFVVGGILTSYLFVFRARRRRMTQLDLIDDPDHSHVDG